MTSILPRINNIQQQAQQAQHSPDVSVDVGPPQKETKHQDSEDVSFFQKHKYIIYTFAIITFLLMVITYLWLRHPVPKPASPPRKPDMPEQSISIPVNQKPKNINELARSIDPKTLDAMREKGRRSAPIPKHVSSSITITEEPDNVKQLKPEPKDEESASVKYPKPDDNDDAEFVDDEYEEDETTIYYKLDADGNIAAEYNGIDELQNDGYDFKEVAKCCSGEIDKHKNAKFTTTKPN